VHIRGIAWSRDEMFHQAELGEISSASPGYGPILILTSPRDLLDTQHFSIYSRLHQASSHVLELLRTWQVVAWAENNMLYRVRLLKIV